MSLRFRVIPRTLVLMMTVHKLSTGDGHLYYTQEVASGDQLRSEDRELGDYYQVTGMPPGQWVGSGVEHFELDGAVTEVQMDALFGDGYSPIDPGQLEQEQAEIRAAAEEAVRVKYARETYAALSQYRPGEPNLQTIQALGTSRSSFYRMLDRHRELGNYKRFKDASATGDEQGFIDGYVMTKAQSQEATAAGKDAIAEGNDDWVDATRLGRKPGEYVQEPANDFTRALDEEHRRHFKTHDAPPTDAERKEIRSRVAGQLFRDTHGRDATGVELATFIANNTAPRQQSVAGYDLVFTPTKSVSMAWGLGDENRRSGIEAAQEAAIADVVSYLEDNAIYARRGRGGVEQIDTDKGLVATKFRHYDSRNGDPNLHDHLVVALSLIHI